MNVLPKLAVEQERPRMKIIRVVLLCKLNKKLSCTNDVIKVVYFRHVIIQYIFLP
jgi:hypothetical protein